MIVWVGLEAHWLVAIISFHSFFRREAAFPLETRLRQLQMFKQVLNEFSCIRLLLTLPTHTAQKGCHGAGGSSPVSMAEFPVSQSAPEQHVPN